MHYQSTRSLLLYQDLTSDKIKRHKYTSKKQQNLSELARKISEFLTFCTIKLSLRTPQRHVRRVEVMVQSFSTSLLHGCEWLTPRPGRFTPKKEIRMPSYRRMGGLQDPSGRMRKISPPDGLFFFVFSFSLYFIRTCFFVLIVLHSAFFFT